MTTLLAKTGLFPFVVLLVVGSDCLAVSSFSSSFQTGIIQNALVNEASGIAASRLNANVLWTHDDSGNPPQIFSMTPGGSTLGTYTISGASNVDWEDIAVGPGPLPGSQYLYIGDIGDNGAGRSNIAVYRMPEPVVSDTQSPVTTSLAGASKLTFSYPDGPRDAESMFVDPLTSDIYIISKRENPHRVYRAAYPQATSGTTTLEYVTEFDHPNWLTGADISVDGNEIILRGDGVGTVDNTGRMFIRPVGGSIADAFNSTPQTIPLVSDGQGEAIAFDPNGWGYYTTSEGSSRPIHYFNRLPPPATTVYWDNDGAAAGSYIASGTGIGGTGTWNTSAKWYNGSSTIPWSSGNNAVFWGAAGTVTLNAAQSVNSLTFKTNGYTLTGAILNLAGPSIAVDSGVTATVSNILSGTAGLVKNGEGTLNLSGGNSYSGNTTVAAGTLRVLNISGSATGTGSVTVNSGAEIHGDGIIQGEVTNSGAIAPGTSLGTLHLGSTYTQSTDGKLDIELAAVGHDKLAITGVATLGGTLDVSLAFDFVPQQDDVFEIITAAGFGDTTFTNVLLPSLTGDLEWNLDYCATSVTLSVALPGDFNHDGFVDAADYVVWRKGGGVFTPGDYSTWREHLGEAALSGESLIAVPEPAAWMLLTVGLAAVLINRFAVVPYPSGVVARKDPA